MICCVCGHLLEGHILEEKDPRHFGPVITGWWRCHHLAGDGYQCECRLMKWADSKLEDYDQDKRAAELVREGL